MTRDHSSSGARFRWRLSILAPTLLSVACLGAASSGVVATAPANPELKAIVDSPRLLEAAIRADIRFRKSLHFRAGRQYVRSLYEHPGRTTGTRAPGILLTAEENAEFDARESLNDDIAFILDAVAKNELQTDFGGLAVDNATGELAVFLKTGTPTGWLTGTPHPGRISVRVAELSESRLMALKQSITSDVKSGEPGTSSVTAVGLDSLSNSVRVYFDPEALEGLAPGEFPTAFETRYDTSHLVRGSSRGAEGTAADQVKGGWSWGHSTSGYRCTVGFAVDKSDAPSYYDYVVSAGHCVHSSSENGDPAYHNYGSGNPPDGRIGLITSSHIFDGTEDMDAALLRITEGDGFTSEARVIHESSGTNYALVVTGKVSGQVQYTNRCHTGKGTLGTLCGQITDSSINVQYGVSGIYSARWIDDMVQIDVTATEGDSGGPAYHKQSNSDDQPNTVEAAGLLTARDGDDVHSYYVKIQNALDWVSSDAGATITIKKWAAAPGCTPLTSCPQDDGDDYP